MPVNAVFSAPWLRALRRTGVPLDRNRRPPGAAVGLLSRADYRCLPQGHRSRSPQQPQHEHRRGRRSRHSAPPRPSGTAVWPSAASPASESASQRTPERLPNPPGYSRVPPKSRKMPVNAVFSAPWLRALRRTGVPLDRNRSPPGAAVGLLSRADYRCLTVSGPPASESASQRLPERLPNPPGYSRVPPQIRKVPVNAVPSAAVPAPLATPAPRSQTTIRHRHSVG